MILYTESQLPSCTFMTNLKNQLQIHLLKWTFLKITTFTKRNQIISYLHLSTVLHTHAHALAPMHMCTCAHTCTKLLTKIQTSCLSAMKYAVQLDKQNIQFQLHIEIVLRKKRHYVQRPQNSSLKYTQEVSESIATTYPVCAIRKTWKIL
jgi:hypothetical protein